MNISTAMNANTARRPRKLPAATAVLSRAQAKVWTSQGSHRGHASPRRRCPDSRGRQAAPTITAASRDPERAAAAGERGPS